MKTISVSDSVGANCITIDDGRKIFEIISPFLKKGEDVELNFSNVKTVASPFFNFCIGTILNEYSLEEYERLLTTVNLSDSGKDVLDRVIENSTRFRSLSEKDRKAMELKFFDQSNSD